MVLPLPGEPAHRWGPSEPVVEAAGEPGQREEGGEEQHLRRRMCEVVRVLGCEDI